MTNPRKDCRSATGAIGVIASLLALLASPIPATQETKPDNRWNMTYHAGAMPIPAERQIGVAIENGKIFLRMKKGPEFVIPLGEVTAVSSNEIGHHGAVSRAELKFAGSVIGSGCGSGEAAYGCAAILFGTLLLAGPSYPIKTTERVVRIVWRDKNTDQEIILKLRKDDYEPFLSELKKATPKPWKNVNTEWAKVQEELNAGESGKVALQLDRKVRVAKADLEPGNYQLVLLQRDSNSGDLYFFPGEEVNAERLAAVAPVEVEPTANEAQPLQVDYKRDADGNTIISTIQVSSKVFRFP